MDFAQKSKGWKIMPFSSDKQRRFMFARHPKIARKWADEEKQKYRYGGTIGGGESVAGTSSSGTDAVRHVFKEGGVADFLDPEKIKKFKFGKHGEENEIENAKEKKKSRKHIDKKKKKNAQAYIDWIEGKGPKPEADYPSYEDGGTVGAGAGSYRERRIKERMKLAEERRERKKKGKKYSLIESLFGKD